MDIKSFFFETLKNSYAENELRSLYYYVLETITGKSLVQILTDKNNALSNTECEKIKAIALRLKENEPIQYILGEAEFCGHIFNVTPSVLIPRPETSDLVEWVTDSCKEMNQLRLLDIGTGSGCIAISLALALPNADVTAVDISANALAVATKNANRNQAKIHFICDDVLHEKFLENEANFDVIVSNPPYICQKEKAEMHRNVLDYEPELALFVPDEKPLLFYEKIAQFAQKKLNKNGLLFFEINRAYGNETVTMLHDIGFSEITLKKDYVGNDRMIMAIK